jgi:hypothetical protein
MMPERVNALTPNSSTLKRRPQAIISLFQSPSPPHRLANVTVMGVCSAQDLFLLSTAASQPMGSYAQLVELGEESLSSRVMGLKMKLA